MTSFSSLRTRVFEDCKEFPHSISIDSTSACNLRCSMCDHVHIKEYRKIETMPFALYTRLIDEIATERPQSRVWLVFFGEPFLCQDMPQRIAYAKKQGLQDVVLNSNGTLITEQKARAYIEAGLDALYVGVDALTQETYAKMRIGGNLASVISNVQLYAELLQKAGKPEQKIFVQFITTEHNAHEVTDFKAFWAAHNIAVKVRPKVSWGGLVDAGNLNASLQAHRLPCYWMLHTMVVGSDGSVHLCAVDVHGRVLCGSVLSHSMKELWQNGPLASYRHMHLGGDYEKLPDICRQCMDWQSAYADFHLPNKEKA